MTREEVITMLYVMRADNLNLDDDYTKDKYDAISMAIKALEQELCDDCISRQAVIDLIEHYNSDGLGSVFYGYDEGVKFANAVNKLPLVNPQEPKQGHWIETNGTILNHRNQILHEVICSECCGIAYFRSIGNEYISANLCPNCGCRMSEVSE